MAPITATSVGIPRQIIDDPKLINLLKNLSKFDVISTNSNTSAKGINNDGTASGNVGDNLDAGNKDEDGDITMSNAEQGTEDEGAAPPPSSTSNTQKHNEPSPLDINGLVNELSAFPKWQFQEQADLYEWIHPLNTIDATINYFIKEYPSLLLPTSSANSNGDTNKTFDMHNQQEEVPTTIISQLSTILTFLSQLLKNSINKSIFNSVTELSLLLSSSNDDIVSLSINVLCSLSIPPMLHRQSCPELSGHVTALHRASRQGFGGSGRWQPGSSTTNSDDGDGEDGRDECNVMWKLISLAKGWGSKGSGLGLLDCITLDDVDLMDENNSAAAAVDGEDNAIDGGNEDKENKQQIKALQKCAGEISFECYVQPKKKVSGANGVEEQKQKSGGHLVTLYVPKEEMFIQPASSTTHPMSTTSSPTTNHEESSSDQVQAEKRRRIGSLSPKKTTFPQIKSTSQLYYECLAKISTQLDVTEDATSILSSEQLYTLLSSIRLARSFHTSSTRMSGVEDRLRALTCMIHSYTSSENVGAYFIAQPELVGELVDLLRPTVSSGNISSGVVLNMENDDSGEEEKKTDSEGVTTLSNTTAATGGQQQNTSILALSDSPIVPYSIRTLAIEALTALVARRDASTGSVSSLSRQTNVLSELGVGKGQYLGLLPTLIRYSLAALNSFLLHDNNSSSASDGSIKMSNTDSGKEKSVKDIGLELGLAFLKATKAPPLPQSEREERALEFIDSVLTLTSSVISVPSGTASLTDCGIIPALVSTIALDGQMARRSLTDETKSTFCTSTGSKSESYSDCLMKFISAQAIQILEGAIVTHNSALSAFHELKGVDILVQRLHVEVEKVKRQAGVVESSSSSAAAADASGASEGVTDMAVDEDDTPTDTTSSKPRHPRTLHAARRTLLFSAVNCLTVVFHQHEIGANNPATTPPSGGALLRKPELHDVLLEIMDNIDSYGAVLAALVATFITDAMNSDPQSVHYVHKSGLAKSFMSLLMDKKPTKDKEKAPTEDTKEKKGMTTEDKKLMVKLVYNSSMSSKSELVTELLAAHPSIAPSRGNAMQEMNDIVERKENPNASGFVWVVKDSIIEKLGLTKDELEDKLPNPILEPSSELIMALPNVIMALSLTEAGAKVVAEANPFPAMMSVFCNPKYVMPNSRCLLNEMAAILGTGLDECMRHNPSLKTKCLKAVVQAMKRIVTMGQELMAEEDAAAVTQATKDLETARTCLIQYGYNIVQLLEQVVHSEDHVSSFVSAGGFDALLDLAKYSIMAGGRAQVANVTCISTPSVSTVQSSISKTLSLLTRTVCSNTTDPSKLIKKIIKRLDSQLIEHGDCIKEFTKKDDSTLVCDSILENIPTLALPKLEDTDDNRQLIQSLSKLFRGFDHLDWLTSSLASILRAACQRANELGLSREREWKKEISSKSFEGIMSRLSLLHRSSLYEVCRIRTQPGFDERDEIQSKAPEQPLVYKIRIVCQEGAIIRNGIDIDRCENVGNMEMGEVVCAYDRCINSSGVLRYHTSRGWVSELTRGGGRENIAEVLDVSVLTGTPPIMIGSSSSEVGIKRVELGVSDLQSASASVLARLQKGSTALLQCFSMLQTSGIRTTSPRLTFQNNTVAPHVIGVSKLLSSNIRANLEYDPGKKDESETGDESMDDDNTDKKESSLAKCMYLGSQLNALQAALYDEKRDEHRSVFNLPLLINLFAADGWKDGVLPVSIDGSENKDSNNDGGGVIMSAIRFVLLEGLRDMADFAAKDKVNVQEEGTDSSTQHKTQRMSRAVAASFPPTLSLLRRLVSRPLLVGSQMASTLTKMKSEDFASLITTLPETDDDQTPKFNAAQFTRSVNMKLAKLSFQDVFSDDKFSCVPSHVLFPWTQYLSDMIGSLEEASKVVEPVESTTTSSTTERPTIGSLLAGGRAGQGGGRLLNPAALNNLNLIQQLVGGGLGGAAGGPEEEEEIFEPSEESINQLAEMGFSREHATEALEMSGTNRVEIAMEYALTHPPSSPATLERRRAAREQRRQQQQNRRNELAALEETAANNNAAAFEAAERELSGDTNEDDTSDNKPKEDSDDSSKDKEKEDSKPKPLSEEELKAKKEKEVEEKSAAEATKLLQTMKDTLISTCLNIIESSDTSNVPPTNSEDITTKQDVVNDPSSCVIIMANFLLGVSKSYPDLESNIATKLLERLKGKVDVKSPSHCRVKSGSEEASFASLCHASVVIFRARPNLRPMILRQGLVGIITHCIRAVTLTSALRGNGKDASSSPESTMAWPSWLTPALLLLEVMAQPTSATLEEDVTANKKSEYGKLLAEHKKISTSQEKAMKNVYSLVTNNKDDSKTTLKKSKKAGESKKKKHTDKKSSDKTSDSDAQATEGESKEKAEVDPKTNPPPIPLLHAMMRTETQEACMLLSLQLLGLKSKPKKGGIDKAHLERVCPPPVVVNAILVLLVRLLRSRKLASLCLQMGGADLILALPDRSYFSGNRDIVSLALRRMLEDEVTLHSMMETEIRSIITKVYKKQHPGSSAISPKVNLKSFMTACTPLICRDSVVFFKAIISSVKIESTGSASSSLASSRGTQVTLLSNEEKAKNAKILASHFAKNATIDATITAVSTTSDKPNSQDEAQPRRRSKSPHRSSLSKSPGKSSLPVKNTINGTPANHIATLLLRDIMRGTDLLQSSTADEKRPFLSTLDYLDTLSDLVLAVPACGAAIHRYKPTGSSTKFHHAISGCPDPPQTAVSFILHKLLPQPREISGSNATDSDKALKLQAYNKTKLSQAGARLIVCLVARSGEGRRRVIADLVFALSSCGQSKSVKESDDDNTDMWAISTWSDLVFGLSSPRSAPSPTGQDSSSNLSFGVLKMLLEARAPHALMCAMERINLHNPMSSSVATSVIRPLEILSRSTVYSTVSDMAEKEKAKMEAKQTTTGKDSRRSTFGPTERSESALYDAGLEDDFNNPPDESMDDTNSDIEEDDDDESMEEDDSESEIEVRLGNVDYSDEEDDNSTNESEDDEEISSDEDDDGSSSGSSVESDDIDNESDGEEESMDNSDEEEVDMFPEADEDDEVAAEENLFFDAENEADLEGMPGIPPGMEGVDGEWAVVPPDGGRAGAAAAALGLGGIMPGGIMPGGIMPGMPAAGLLEALGLGGPRGRAPGGGGEDAEAMLGNIVRGDSIGLRQLQEQLANLEQLAGQQNVRVVRGNRASGGGLGGLGVSSIIGSPPVPELESVNVHQRTFGSNSRSLLLSPMESVFGVQATRTSSRQGYVGDGHEGQDEIPSLYDTQLFPGGISSSTQTRAHPTVHPLLQSVSLAPSNSIYQLENRSDQSHALGGLRSRSFITGANGNLIQVHDRFHDGADPRRGGRQGAHSGWTDDGIQSDRSTEDFCVAFGSALNDMMDRVDAAQASLAEQNNDNSGGDDNNEQDNEARNDVAEEAETDEVMNEAEDDPAEDQAETENSEDSNEPVQPPPAQEQPSEDAAVSSAMADGLTIDSGASNEQSVNNETNNDDSTSNDAVMEDGQAAEEETEPAPDEQQAAENNESSEEANQNQEEDSGQDSSNAAGANDDDNQDQQAMETDSTAPAAGPSAEEVGNAEAPTNEESNEAPSEEANNEASAASEETNNGTSGELTCPPDIDPEVFASLPLEMQQEVVEQHQQAQQISESGLDPEALAALPEDMRREVIAQEQNEQRQREQQAAQPAADPANAEEMDNASFLASLTPDLRQEILLTADDTFIQSLPPNIIAEANVLRERVNAQHRQAQEAAAQPRNAAGGGGGGVARRGGGVPRLAQPDPASRRRQRNGKLRIEADRDKVVYTPSDVAVVPLLTAESSKAFISLLYLLSPVQPQRTIHNFARNLCMCEQSRSFLLQTLVGLLNNDNPRVLQLIKSLDKDDETDSTSSLVTFPPTSLIGVPPVPIQDRNPHSRHPMFRRRPVSNTAVTIAASLPASSRGSSHSDSIPPVVARRVVGLLAVLCKSSARVSYSMLCNSSEDEDTCMEKLLDLLQTSQYSQSASNLEQLMNLIDIAVAPMALLTKEGQEVDISADRPSQGKVWVKVPRVVVSKKRLHSLVNTLRLESCVDASFLKINNVMRRLCRVEANKLNVLNELALVAEGLGKAAILDMKAVSVRLRSAAKHHKEKAAQETDGDKSMQVSSPSSYDGDFAGTPSSAVSLSTSNSELKLLRVLQMLYALCSQDEDKGEGLSAEFSSLLKGLNLEALWDQLNICLTTVSVLEGVANIDVDENDDADGDDGEENETTNEGAAAANGGKKPKLQNSVAGLITRFLPAIEAFFMINASPSPASDDSESASADNSRLVEFAASNKILLNALLRSNPSLLEKGLRAMVKMPKCRVFLDFDVKRAWFKTQVRRLRQQASRRYGSVRLNLRRKHVFDDSFHAFVHRNAEELRGRLQITFAEEEGVDAGGLSREFFAILAKEMFNPNYALFMSTEDGCTFQPNPNSTINPDDKRYFKFVGRIVGKAVSDGFLLDAHFTRSLYKHMLGVKPTHHDMQAIDPDYYKNLQMILEHKLEDIGLDLTFSTEDHAFGRSKTIDLIPDGHKVPVTEESKAKYVDLVCQYRMTTAIEKQIKAFLEGFHEMVDIDLISIFTAKELELLISGMPDIDIHDLKKNTDYNGYRPADKLIGWFWNIMFNLSKTEKAAFLQFVTGSSKVPLAGFSELQGMRGVQKFSINKAGGGDTGALMSAHTCFNALDLPEYKSEEEMKEKLLLAISEGAGGFGFA